MPSNALLEWNSVSLGEINNIRQAHTSLSIHGRGHRYVTQQINEAYVVLLCARWQRFCRALHTECAGYLSRAIEPEPLQDVVLSVFLRARELDYGNANPPNIRSDFERLGISLWDESIRRDKRNRARRSWVDQMNKVRNAIAHQDFKVGTPNQIKPPTFKVVGQFDRACRQLVRCFDSVMRDHITGFTGRAPWS